MPAGLGGRHSGRSGEDVFVELWERQLEALARVLTRGNESMMESGSWEEG